MEIRRFVQRTMCDQAVNLTPPKGWGRAAPLSPQIKGKGLQGVIWWAWQVPPELGGHCSPASGPCLENLKGKGGLACCSALEACSHRVCGCNEHGDISHGTQVAHVGIRAGLEPFWILPKRTTWRSVERGLPGNWGWRKVSFRGKCTTCVTGNAVESSQWSLSRIHKKAQ